MDPLQTVAERIYDSHGRLKEVNMTGVDGTWSKQGVEYFNTGEVKTNTQIFTVGGTVRTFKTSYIYTPKEGRLKTITNPLGKTTHFEYNKKGQLFKRTDAKKQLSKYKYDNSGRVTQIEYYTPAPRQLLRTLTMTYDGMGRLVTESDGQYSRKYFRDQLGRIKEIKTTLPSASSPRTFNFEYVDGYGQLTALRDSEGFYSG